MPMIWGGALHGFISAMLGCKAVYSRKTCVAVPLMLQVSQAYDFKNVYGMRMCLQCPHCTNTLNVDGLGQDVEGLSTEVDGGSIGRILTLAGASEFQKKKKRDEHIHYQAVVACLHTSSSLHTLMSELEVQGRSLIERYKEYVNHSCLQRYQEDVCSAQERQCMGEKKTWPAHAMDQRLSRLPVYLGKRVDATLSIQQCMDEGRTWKRSYLQDLNHVICMRQEHVRPIDPHTGARKPLTACHSKTKPLECKHGFPMDHLIHDSTLLLCPGLASERGMAIKGKRNAAGAFWSSRNSGTINATVPAMAVGTGDNNDIKIPYRFGITATSHEMECQVSWRQPCASNEKYIDTMMWAVETSQAAQVCYHCDYCNKRQPLGVAEANEWDQIPSNLEQRNTRIRRGIYRTTTCQATLLRLLRSGVCYEHRMKVANSMIRCWQRIQQMLKYYNWLRDAASLVMHVWPWLNNEQT